MAKTIIHVFFDFKKSFNSFEIIFVPHKSYNLLTYCSKHKISYSDSYCKHLYIFRVFLIFYDF